MNKSNKFEYSYSAPTEDERREIDSIRKQYQFNDKNESKLAQLRALDKKVKRPADIIAIVLGVVGALILGVGMCLTMEVIGGGDYFILGIAAGIVGIAICALNYFIYNSILTSRKKKYGEEILKLSEELLNERREDK